MLSVHANSGHRPLQCAQHADVALIVACMVGAVSPSRLDLQLKMYREAKDDCDAALELSFTIKSLIRRGKAYVGLDNLLSAVKDFQQVLVQEPGNRYACMMQIRALQLVYCIARPFGAGASMSRPGLCYCCTLLSTWMRTITQSPGTMRGRLEQDGTPCLCCCRDAQMQLSLHSQH